MIRDCVQWTQEQRRVTHAETSRMLTGWRRDPETLWLAEPPKGPFQAALRHLQTAFVNFRAKRAGFPSFKKEGRIADRRRDHLHQLSTRPIRENQTVAIEDLPVRNLLRNHSLARAISDASWSELRRMVEYKAGGYGRTVIAVDRFYPSSKTCSSCGVIVAELPLHVRKWECVCGAVHDRDVNADRAAADQSADQSAGQSARW
jgi:IS605 OrfB family transposase